MEELHRNVRRVLLECRRQLETLEAASSNATLDPAASSAVQEAFRMNLFVLGRDLGLMRSALAREPAPRREVWRARVKDLEDQLSELHAEDLRVAERFRAIAAEVSVREELFQRRTGAARGDAVIGFGPQDPNFGGAAAEHRSLNASSSGVSNILSTGAGALEALVNQRLRLKSARRKVMDIMNTTETGRRLIAQIEKRDNRDAIIMYSLMVGILLLMGAAVLYKHSRKQSHLI